METTALRSSSRGGRPHSHRSRRRGAGRRAVGVVAVLLLAVATGVWLPGAAVGAGIAVDTSSDVAGADGSCSLREAITAANDDSSGPGGDCAKGSGADTIQVPAGTYVLSGAASENGNATGDLDILSTLTIAGAGSGATTIDANQVDRVLDVGPTGVTTISGVTITGGRAPSGRNGSNMFGGVGTGNPTDGGDAGDGQPGGGIRSLGTLTVADSAITNNAAGAGGSGGSGTGGSGAFGVFGGNGGRGRGGSGGSGGDGGGVFASGSATLARTVVSGNVAGVGGVGGTGIGGQGGAGLGGGVGGDGGDGVGGAPGRGGQGGGISAGAGTLTVDSSSSSANTAGAGGAGGLGQGGAGGVCTNPGVGGAGGNGTGAAGAAGGSGGGISADSALVARNDLIDGNEAGAGGKGGHGVGALGGHLTGPDVFAGDGGDGTGGRGGGGGSGGGAVALSTLATNNTITGNRPGAGGTGGNGTGGRGGSTGAMGSGTPGDGGHGIGASGGDGGSGGGLRATGGSVLRHATITSNSVAPGGAVGSAAAGAGGLDEGGVPGSPGIVNFGAPGSSGSGGGESAAGGALLQNSIVSANDVPSCDGAVTDDGHNIGFPDAACPSAHVDPLLSPLADNGGPTRTQAPNAGSIALDGVPPGGAGCPATDQRGVSRPQGPACDIGAFEVPVPTPPGGPGVGGTPPSFGARTLVTLRLAAARIPATGPLRVRVTNANAFEVTGTLSGRTTNRISLSQPRRIGLRARPARVGANARKTVNMKLTKALRRLLKRERQLSLRLTARVKDPAGHSRSVHRTVKPKLKQPRKPRG